MIQGMNAASSDDWPPQTALEEAFVKAEGDPAFQQQFAHLFVNWDLRVAGKLDRTLSPPQFVLFRRTANDGHPCVTAYPSTDALSKLEGEGQEIIVMKGGRLISCLQPGVGIALRCRRTREWWMSPKLIALLVSSLKLIPAADNPAKQVTERTRPCRSCGKTIKASSEVCEYCGEETI